MDKWRSPVFAALVCLPGMLFAQVEHWSFEAICTGLEAPFFKDIYTAPGHYRVQAKAGNSGSAFIADSLLGRGLALFSDEGAESWHFYSTCPDSLDHFTPTDIIDLERAQVAVNPSSDTKTVFGLTLLRVDLYLGGKPIGEAWVAEQIVVPGAYAFALPDGRRVTVLEVRYETLNFYAATRLIGYERSGDFPSDLFSIAPPGSGD